MSLVNDIEPREKLIDSSTSGFLPQSSIYMDSIIPTTTQISIDDNPDIIFFVEFTGGYAFRQLFELLKMSVLSAPLFFTEKKV